MSIGNKHWHIDGRSTLLLAKVGEIEHLRALQKGEVYMKPLGFHKQNEKNHPNLGVGDRKEGILQEFTPEMDFEMIVDGEKVEGVVRAEVTMNAANPVFCCLLVDYSQVRNGALEIRFDPRMIADFANDPTKEYGFLLFEHKGFMERVQSACVRNRIGWIARSVIYTDDFLSRMIVENGLIVPPAFFKKTELSYQKEFRILLYENVEDHYILDIGDISDISRIYSREALMNGIKLMIKEEDKNV